MYDKSKFSFSPLFDEVLGHDMDPVSDDESIFDNFYESITDSLRSSFSWHSAAVANVFGSAVSNSAVSDSIVANKSRRIFPPGTISHGLCGFGRRNSLLLVYVAAIVLANREALKQQGLRLHFTIFDKQVRQEAGSGYSCQTNCDGALNSTGLPGQVKIASVIPDQLPIDDFTQLTNLAKTIVEDLQSDIPGHKDTLREQNLAALAMFTDAINSLGKIDPGQAFTTRGAVGRILNPKVLAVLDYIRDEMSDVITVEEKFQHEVLGVSLDDPRKPELEVRPVDRTHGYPSDFPTFDFVHLSNGTPWRTPVPNLKSSDLPVFSGIPNLRDVGDFLHRGGFLDGSGEHPEKRILKPGSRFAITGFSLASYDFVPLILHYTSILEPTQDGYELIEAEAEKYQGLITFVSMSGVPPPPRHVIPNPTSPVQPLIPLIPTTRDVILTTKEVHAMLLQKDFQWIQFWKVFLDANIARSLGKRPCELQSKQFPTAKDRMRDYSQQTREYYDNRLTEAGLLRTGYWAIFGGQGFEHGQALEEAEQELIGFAPLTRSERAGFQWRRASLSDVTNLDYVKAGNPNTDFFHEQSVMYYTINASAPKVHQLAAQLFELGVAKHVTMNFNDIRSGELKSSVSEEEPVSVQALFGPMTLDRGADRVFKSLRGQVAEVVPGQPEYAKGRFLKDREGKFVHAMDMGMGGNGSRYKSEDGRESQVGMRWPDTTFLDAAANGASTAAVMAVLLSSYAKQQESESSGRSPVDCLVGEYERGLPSSEEYEREVAQFQPVWEETHKKHAFLKLCGKVARDGPQYAVYTGGVVEEAKRREVVKQLELEQHEENRRAIADYHKAVESIPPFAPPSVHDYFERFIDFSPSEIRRCWNQHRESLLRKGKAE